MAPRSRGAAVERRRGAALQAAAAAGRASQLQSVSVFTGVGFVGQMSEQQRRVAVHGGGSSGQVFSLRRERHSLVPFLY